MRALVAAGLALALSSSTVLAAVDSVGPLQAGKPAGVKQADLSGSTLFIFLGAAAIAGIALAVSNNGNNSITTATTGTAP